MDRLTLLKAAGSAAAVLLFCGCTVNSAYDRNTINFAELSAEKTYRLEGTAAQFGTDSDWVFIDSVSMIMPMLIGNKDLRPLQDIILKTAFDTTGVDHNALISNYFKTNAADAGFAARETDIKINLSRADGYDITTGLLNHLSAEWLVYCVNNEHMAPHAAHGMKTKYYINYLIPETRVITLDDIFTEDGLASLPATIANRAVQQEDYFGPTDIDSLPANGNFYISADNEIVFAYQPYEVASYAQGYINIAFYPYELAKHMNKFGLCLFGLNNTVY